MSIRLPESFERAIAPMRRVRLAPSERIDASLKAICKLLKDLEVAEPMVAAFMERALEAYGVKESREKAEAELRTALAATLSPELLRVSAIQPMPVTRTERCWDLKELDNRTPLRREADWAPKAIRFPRPVAERPATGKVDFLRTQRFEAVAANASLSQGGFARGMNSVRMAELLRNMGKGMPDGGAEPPDGGQPARI